MPTVENAKTTLSEKDLDVILDVFEKTGIVTFTGPETAKLFKGKIPGHPKDEPLWPSIPELGTSKFSQGHGPAAAPERQMFRRVEMLFLNSLEYEDGIPVGCWDVSTKKDMFKDEYVYQNTIFDIPFHVQQRLRSHAWMQKHMTDRERRIDEARKERARAEASAPDHQNAMKALGDLITAAAAAKSAPAEESDG